MYLDDAHVQYFSANQVCNGPFTGLFGVLYGVPTLAILAMRQTRFLSALGMIAWLVAIAIAITRAPLTHRTFAKSITICKFQLNHADAKSCSMSLSSS